ncbi:MAG: lysylphosphatidylglycerol synthase transmembrane domain-containing protein [Peptoniphilaceae bacterium]
MKKNNYKNIFKFIFLLTIVGIVIYIFKNQVPPIIKEIKNTSIKTLLLISLCGLLYQFFDGLSLKAIVENNLKEISIVDTFACSLYSAFYRVVTFGSGTYLSIIYFFKKIGFDVSYGFSISIINYMGQKIAMVFWAIILYFLNYNFINGYFLEYKKYLFIGMILGLLIVISFVFLCISKKFHSLILKLFNLDKKEKFYKLRIKLEDLFSEIEFITMNIFKDKAIVLKILFFNFTKYLFWYIISFIIFYKDANFSLLDYISVTSLIILLSSVIPAPGGMGSTEFVFSLIFSNLLNGNIAISGMLLYRFANFLIPTIGGAIVALIIRFKNTSYKVN